MKTVAILVLATMVMAADVPASGYDYKDANGIRHWNLYKGGKSPGRHWRSRYTRHPFRSRAGAKQTPVLITAGRGDALVAPKCKPETIYAPIEDIEAAQNEEAMQSIGLAAKQAPPWAGRLHD